MLWTQLSFPRMTLMLLYHMLTIHALCHAPFYGWLLFVSAWARRAVFVWIHGFGSADPFLSV